MDKKFLRTVLVSASVAITAFLPNTQDAHADCCYWVVKCGTQGNATVDVPYWFNPKTVCANPHALRDATKLCYEQFRLKPVTTPPPNHGVVGFKKCTANS